MSSSYSSSYSKRYNSNQSPRHSAPSSSRFSNQSRPRFNNRQPCRKQFCFFGDSFIRKFGLVKHQSIDIQGYKGATAKGLSRIGNENRKKILQMVQSRPHAERLVFNFGNVDVHLSHYYSLYGGKDEAETLNLKSIAENYVDFIASLPLPPSVREVTILGVYPSAPEDQFVKAILVSYGILTEEQVAKIPTEDAMLSARRKRVDRYNLALQQRCEMHNIKYEDAVEEMTDQNGRLREAFRDVSDHNIHVIWETTILLWMRRWPWYKSLAPRGFEEDMKKTLSEYIKTKPWAERSQIAEKIGVHAAVNAEDNCKDEGVGDTHSK